MQQITGEYNRWCGTYAEHDTAHVTGRQMVWKVHDARVIATNVIVIFVVVRVIRCDLDRSGPLGSACGTRARAVVLVVVCVFLCDVHLCDTKRGLARDRATVVVVAAAVVEREVVVEVEVVAVVVYIWMYV